MPENNDLNTEQSVTAPDLKDAGSVAQQDLTDQSVTDQNQDVETLADGTKTDKTIKYSEFEKVNKKNKELEERIMLSERDRDLLQANMQGQQQATQQTQQQPASTYEQAMQELDLTVDDLYGENILKVNARKDQLDAAKNQYNQTITANQTFVNSHSDFSQVVGSVNPATGAIPMPSKEAAAILQKKPYLANASYEAVYNEIIQERQFTEFQNIAAAEKEHLIRAGVEAGTLPLGGSAAGGGTGGDNQTPQMLSREAQQEILRKLANGETV